MKKAIIILLALVMVLSLAACGGGSTETNTPAPTAMEVPTQAPAEAPTSPAPTAESNQEISASNDVDGSIVEFEDVIIWEDENVTIALIQFYEEECNWADWGKQNEKVVSFKVTNHTSKLLSISSKGFYLDDEAAYVCSTESSSRLAAGKSGRFNYIVSDISKSKHSALASIDELYKLNGTMEVQIINDNNGQLSYEKKYNIDFNIQAAVNGERVLVPAELTLYSIGDTVSTDTLAFTLDGFDYIYHLDTKTYAEKDDISGGAIGPGKDMVFANPEYTIKNTSKESIDAINAAIFTIDYNDGYKYGMEDGRVCYIVDVPGVKWKWNSKGSGEGSKMTLSPLTAEDYNAYIPAINLIDTDNEAPLILYVELLSSTGTESFAFKIR